MTRILRVGAAQMGPIQKSETRSVVVPRLLAMMRRAKEAGAHLVVFPELALTTFFPRWVIDDPDALDAFYEETLPNPATQPLFDFARDNRIGFYLGYAELARDGDRVRRFNSAVLVGPNGAVVGKYRKVHLPGHAEPEPRRLHQHLEKRYFEVGDLGFPVWRTLGGTLGMALCNDRRWPETFRLLGLRDVELTLIGYNTPTQDALSDEDPQLRLFHNRLCLQAGAYQNSTWVVGVAKAGIEDGHPLMGGSCVVAPTGAVVAEAKTDGEELLVADCDLDRCAFYKDNIFNFAAHRRPEVYGLITERAGRLTGDEPNNGAEV